MLARNLPTSSYMMPPAPSNGHEFSAFPVTVRDPMTARLSFFFGRALPLGVFGFLVVIQAELAIAGLGRLGQDWTTVAYLVNRLLTLAFFSFLFTMYMVRGRAVARDHNPVAVLAAMVGSFILFAMILVPSPARSESLVVLTAIVFVVFVAAEVVRTYYEERVLRRTYPEYAAYAAGTRRLIPLVF